MSLQPTLGVGYDPGRAHAADGHNEDAYGVPPQLDAERLAFYGALYVVADGMGGHARGEVASRLAVDQLQQVYYADPDPNRAGALYRALEAANLAVYQQGGDQGQDRMGSTVVAAVVREDELIAGNVGDSRAYLVRAGIARQISQDHTWVGERVRAGQLKPEDAAHHEMRNVLSRSLGDRPEVEPFVSGGDPLLAGDRLLLCTDGLWELVRDDELAQTISVQPPQSAANALVAAANQRGGHDNITVLVIPVDFSSASPAGVAGSVRATMVGPLIAIGLGALAMLLLALVCSASGWWPAVPPPAQAPVTLAATDVILPSLVPQPESAPTSTQIPVPLPETDQLPVEAPVATDAAVTPSVEPGLAGTPDGGVMIIQYCIIPGELPAYAFPSPAYIVTQQFIPNDALVEYLGERKTGRADLKGTQLPFVKLKYEGREYWILESRLGQRVGNECR